MSNSYLHKFKLNDANAPILFLIGLSCTLSGFLLLYQVIQYFNYMTTILAMYLLLGVSFSIFGLYTVAKTITYVPDKIRRKK